MRPHQNSSPVTPVHSHPRTLPTPAIDVAPRGPEIAAPGAGSTSCPAHSGTGSGCPSSEANSVTGPPKAACHRVGQADVEKLYDKLLRSGVAVLLPEDLIPRPATGARTEMWSLTTP